jgi:hypothetical protein
MHSTLLPLAPLLFLLLLVEVADASSPTLEQKQNLAQVCIDRPENDGVINIEDIKIAISGTPPIILDGGSADCVTVQPGSHTVRLTFMYPYSDPKKITYWTTTSMYFLAKAGETESYILCQTDQDRNDPRWSATGWYDMWILNRISMQTHRHCVQS